MMIDRIVLGVLTLLAAAVVAVAVCRPSLIVENAFLIRFLDQQLVTAMVVMITVSLPVGADIIAKSKTEKRKLRGLQLSEAKKAAMAQQFDQIIDKIKRANRVMVVCMVMILSVLFALSSPLVESNTLTALLAGAAFFFFAVSIALMVEMYRALHNWWSPGDD